MQCLEVKVEGNLDFLPECESKREVEARARKFAGVFLKIGNSWIKLPFKIPFLKYQKATYELNTTFPDSPHVHLKEGSPIPIYL